MDSSDWVFLVAFVAVGIALIYTVIAGIQTAEESKYKTKIYLMEFKDLDCKDMGNSLLQKYLDGETDHVRQALSIFKESGCSFDVATKLILEKP